MWFVRHTSQQSHHQCCFKRNEHYKHWLASYQILYPHGYHKLYFITNKPNSILKAQDKIFFLLIRLYQGVDSQYVERYKKKIYNLVQYGNVNGVSNFDSQQKSHNDNTNVSRMVNEKIQTVLVCILIYTNTQNELYVLRNLSMKHPRGSSHS